MTRRLEKAHRPSANATASFLWEGKSPPLGEAFNRTPTSRCMRQKVGISGCEPASMASGDRLHSCGFCRPVLADEETDPAGDVDGLERCDCWNIKRAFIAAADAFAQQRYSFPSHPMHGVLQALCHLLSIERTTPTHDHLSLLQTFAGATILKLLRVSVRRAWSVHVGCSD
jgi:hypothetical protein